MCETPLAAPRDASWREHLSAAEQQAMYEVMGETLAEVGYLPGFRTEQVA